MWIYQLLFRFQLNFTFSSARDNGYGLLFSLYSLNSMVIVPCDWVSHQIFYCHNDPS